MVTSSLSESEKAILDVILSDLSRIFSMEEIPLETVDELIGELKSGEARNYLNSLRTGSKPETALRESFFAGNSILGKYLFGEKAPEVRAEKLGFIDYVVGESTRFILLELKSLFELTDKGLRQTVLKPDQHKEQILKYFQTGARFAILTNLREWYFFNDLVRPKDFQPFSSGALEDFLKDYEMMPDLWNLLERREKASAGQNLDKVFFDSLKAWVSKLKEVEFSVDDKRKDELIISLINKFIFIQTLDSYWVVSFRRIKTSWEESEKKWSVKGKLIVLEKFFEDIDEWFYAYYDTELFRTKILEYVKKDSRNIELFYEHLQLILGLVYWQGIFGSFRGIMQYNFKLIDEDVFGKAYEAFLAEIRHDEGIYYTPTFVTQYIVENTVGKIFNVMLEEIRNAVNKEDLERLEQIIMKFIGVRVLDPACGSGSFLIKSVRNIWNSYIEANDIVKSLSERTNKYEGKLTRAKEVEEKSDRIIRIQKLLRADNRRELIARILVRHIHANDVDPKALEVAKVNLWLESVKLAPTEFNYQKLPSDTNRILPDLEMNLGHGDSLVGLPFDRAVGLLVKGHRNELQELGKLRAEYLEDPTKSDLVEKIQEIKDSIRRQMDKEFEAYVTENDLPQAVSGITKPFHWPLEYWFLFFDSNGDPLPSDSLGANAVIGNPPYERIQVLTKKAPDYVRYLDKAGYNSAFKNYDLAALFVERGYKLLKDEGEFGYIVTNKFIQADYGEALRKLLSQNKAVKQIINFGDQQVFDDATTYTALLFLSKGLNDKFKYALVRRLEGTFEQMIEIGSAESANERTYSATTGESCDLTSSSWIFASRDEQPIIDRISKLGALGNIRDRIFQGLATGADPVFILDIREQGGAVLSLDTRVRPAELVTVHSNSLKKEYVIEKEVTRPLLKGEGIKKWRVRGYDQLMLFPYIIEKGKAGLIPPDVFERKYPRAWAYLRDNKTILEKRERGKWKGAPNWYAYARRQNLEQFDQPKIMTQVLAHRASFALDMRGEYYFVGGGNAGGYGVTLLKKSPVSLEYVCALLNSSLLDWELKKLSSRFRGGFYSYARRFIEKLAIKIPSRNESAVAKEIEESVRKICQLKQMRYDLISAWTKTSKALKTPDAKFTLFDLLNRDAVKVREGKFQESWTRTVPFYPDGANDAFTKQYSDFIIRGDNDAPKLRLYGLDEDNREQLIYEILFNTREHLLHCYLSMLSLLESRATIHTLSDVVEKTVVPVIRPDIVRNTPNIMRKLKEELKKSSIVPASDAVQIENALEETEARIDALVFKLYGLDQDGMRLVMQDLNLLTSYQQLVMRHSTSDKKRI
jgi:type I restriction-modification system DNA methylase subunit